MVKNSSSLYENLSFPIPKNRPYVITSFVMTMDGKEQVKSSGYWPIGSKTDYETFTYIRSLADIVIDGSGTARHFGKAMIDTIHSESFQKQRSKHKKNNPLPYGIMTSHVDEELMKSITNPYGFVPMIFNTEEMSLPDVLSYLQKEKYKVVFLDGGPTLVGSFLEANAVDEVFLTIAPKIFGNKDGEVLTMVEGKLFPPDEIKKFTLLSVQQREDEVFLRYKKKI